MIHHSETLKMALMRTVIKLVDTAVFDVTASLLLSTHFAFRFYFVLFC